MSLLEWLKWIFSQLGKNPWLTHDKFAHGWLHTFNTAVLLPRYGLHIPIIKNWNPDTKLGAFLISWCFGILYEILDLIWHCVIKKNMKFKDYIKDSLRDIVWNTIGCILGSL